MKNYEITEEQIKEMETWGNSKDAQKVREQWFPEVFETKIITGWFKTKTEDNERYLMYFENGVNKYGFNGVGKWKDKSQGATITSEEYIATDSEVLEALTNEAKKKGLLDSYIILIKGDVGSVSLEKTKTKPYLENGNLCVGSNFGTYTLFCNGKWATPIKTYTKEEAEKLLNAKII